MVVWHPTGRLGVSRLAAGDHHQFAAPLAAARPENHDHAGFGRHRHVHCGPAGGDVRRPAEVLVSAGAEQSGEVLQ